MERHRGIAGVERFPGEPRRQCSWYASLLAAGSVLEASVHPKPGAVTPCASHGDKSFQDFVVHAVALREALEASCHSRGDPLEDGLRAYAASLGILPLPPGNVGLGTALLLIPLAAALPRLGPCDAALLTAEASRVALEAGAGAARAYYDLLQSLSPRHLGRYEGPVPGVGEGYPASFSDVLRAARWDLIHSELLNSYPVTREALEELETLRASGWGLGEAAAKALLSILARRGDTLIAARWGLRAYQRSMEEARVALTLYEKGRLTLREALEWLDSKWRPRGWSPGAALDILAASLGLLLAREAEACAPRAV